MLLGNRVVVYPNRHAGIRLFSEKLLNSGRNTVIAIPNSYHGERVDKFVMNHFKMPWAAAHKLIRTKKAFVVRDE